MAEKVHFKGNYYVYSQLHLSSFDARFSKIGLDFGSNFVLFIQMISGKVKSSKQLGNSHPEISGRL
jgi:hypothetical protein